MLSKRPVHFSSLSTFFCQGFSVLNPIFFISISDSGFMETWMKTSAARACDKLDQHEKFLVERKLIRFICTIPLEHFLQRQKFSFVGRWIRKIQTAQIFRTKRKGKEEKTSEKKRRKKFETAKKNGRTQSVNDVIWHHQQESSVFFGNWTENDGQSSRFGSDGAGKKKDGKIFGSVY